MGSILNKQSEMPVKLGSSFNSQSNLDLSSFNFNQPLHSLLVQLSYLLFISILIPFLVLALVALIFRGLSREDCSKEGHYSSKYFMKDHVTTVLKKMICLRKIGPYIP